MDPPHRHPVVDACVIRGVVIRCIDIDKGDAVMAISPAQEANFSYA
jgi:hypothetical protein